MEMTKKLELMMISKDLDKAALSRNTGIPYTTIDGFWKKGTDNTKRSTLLKLAKYFHCTLDYLADDAIEINNINMDVRLNIREQRLIKKYRALDERGKDVVDAIVDQQYEAIKPEEQDGVS